MAALPSGCAVPTPEFESWWLRDGQHDDLREAGGWVRNEVAVRIGQEQRQVADVEVGQIDAEHLAGLRLHLGPGRQATVQAVKRLAGGDRPIVGHPVLAQEDLVRRVRSIGLVLVDEGRRDILGVAFGVYGRPGQNHEVRGAGGIEKRIIRLQRDQDGAALPLGDEIEAVVEELAEEGEPRVEGGGKSLVRRHVGQDDVDAGHLDAVQRDRVLQDGQIGLRLRRQSVRLGGGDGAQDWRPVAFEAHQVEGLLDRGRIGRRLIDDQVRNRADARIDDPCIRLVRRRGVGSRLGSHHSAKGPPVMSADSVAGRYSGSSRRGKSWSAEPQSVRPGIRLL